MQGESDWEKQQEDRRQEMSGGALRLSEGGGRRGGGGCEGETLRETTAFLVNISSTFAKTQRQN